LPVSPSKHPAARATDGDAFARADAGRRRTSGLGALGGVGFGLWLVPLSGFDYGAGWVDVAIALYIVALVLGGLGGQRPKQARRLASRLADEDVPTASAELRALLADRSSLLANYAAAVAVLAILALMVFKP
jgi:uncharacterized membrane protein